MRPKSDELDTMRPGAASAMLILAIAILPQSARALLQPEPRPHLRTQRPQPAARQRRDGVHRARPDRHAVRRPGAPGARAPSVQLRRERRGGGPHRLHETRRGKNRRPLRARRDVRHRGDEGLDLEAMSRDKVYEFALIVQPLKLKGGTGSTVAPI